MTVSENVITLDAMIDAVKKCGNIITFVDDAERSMIITKEGKANFATKYDIAVQEALRGALLRLMPDAAFIAEEGECCREKLSRGYAFIVDPIDGTTNFMKNYRKSAVSAALAKDGEIIMGVVYNPFDGEVYSALSGGGAFLNEKPIHVSGHPLAEELVLFGTSPYNEELIEPTFELAKTMMRTCYDLRRSGSCALDLCAIASGRCGLYYEFEVSPWDCAAGSLIVTEAGGEVGHMNGDKLDFTGKGSILAANPRCWNDYFKLPGHVEA